MRRLQYSRFIELIFCIVTLFAVGGGLISVAYAGIRGLGKYCGVVIFDRWDTCFLLSGHFITYISEHVKDELRPYAGESIQVDASDVWQPMNPGDALIKKYEIIGRAPVSDQWQFLDGIQIVVRADFDFTGRPAFEIEIRNTGNTPLDVNSNELGPTILGINQDSSFSPSDGGSVAWITRATLLSRSSFERQVGDRRSVVTYEIDPNSRVPQRFELEPGQSRKVRVLFKLPPGEYQFLIGFAGGVHESKSLASNAISFDIDENGRAAVARQVLLSTSPKWELFEG